MVKIDLSDFTNTHKFYTPAHHKATSDKYIYMNTVPDKYRIADFDFTPILLAHTWQ